MNEFDMCVSQSLYYRLFLLFVLGMFLLLSILLRVYSLPEMYCVQSSIGFNSFIHYSVMSLCYVQ